jgi:hypothetical protein
MNTHTKTKNRHRRHSVWAVRGLKKEGWDTGIRENDAGGEGERSFGTRWQRQQYDDVTLIYEAAKDEIESVRHHFVS